MVSFPIIDDHHLGSNVHIKGHNLLLARFTC